MTATTWAMEGWAFPRDLPKVTPEVARHIISNANEAHVLTIAVSGVFVGMALATFYTNSLSQRLLEENKKESELNPDNEALKNSVIRQEKSHYTSRILNNIAGVCMLIVAGAFAAAGYASWRNYRAVAFPELQRIVG